MLKQHEPIAILRGVVGILLLNMVFLTICIMYVPVSVSFSYLLSAIGFSQFIYALPIIIILMYAQRWGILKGVMMGTGITALLNAGYYFVLILKR